MLPPSRLVSKYPKGGVWGNKDLSIPICYYRTMDNIVEGAGDVSVGERFRQWVDTIEGLTHPPTDGTQYSVDPGRLLLAERRFSDDGMIGAASREFYFFNDESQSFESRNAIRMEQNGSQHPFRISSINYISEGAHLDEYSNHINGLVAVRFSERRMYGEPALDATGFFSVLINKSEFNISLQWAVKNGVCSFSITPNYDPSFLGRRTNKAIAYPFSQTTIAGKQGGSYQIEPVPQDQGRVRLVYKDDNDHILEDLLIPTQVDIQSIHDRFSDGIDLEDPLNPNTNFDLWKNLDPVETVGIKYNL